MRGSLSFDGACSGNPGKSAGGAVLRVEASSEPQLIEGRVFHGTNNEAEYNGLLIGLHAALKAGVRTLQVKGDSRLVVEQVHGRWACSKAHLMPLITEARLLLSQFDSWTLEWVPREENSMADRTAGQALRNGMYPRKN